MKFIKQNWFVLFLFLFGIICLICVYLDIGQRITEADKNIQEWEQSRKEWNEYQKKYNNGMRAAYTQVLNEGIDYEEIANADRYIKSIRTNRR